ncbi:hypothetical protein M404DRAFT_18555 [Pisolithus tinctorius Marx 270]|uniref:Uncharacterized protein n=1 Tax=Pisolithus tinctorius Marx 270 TaxID=870435 RepID=A0A0C3PXZ7_PISTI|nr:hypothetical protein M404DRAFT_18555 [Pisolithus tinctorius Marx 270]
MEILKCKSTDAACAIFSTYNMSWHPICGQPPGKAIEAINGALILHLQFQLENQIGYDFRRPHSILQQFGDDMGWIHFLYWLFTYFAIIYDSDSGHLHRLRRQAPYR